MTAKKLVDDMYLKGNVITVTGKRIPHNIGWERHHLGNKPPHF